MRNDEIGGMMINIILQGFSYYMVAHYLTKNIIYDIIILYLFLFIMMRFLSSGAILNKF